MRFRSMEVLQKNGFTRHRTRIVVPPGGFAGVSQQTAAAQLTTAGALQLGNNRGPTRYHPRKRKPTPRRAKRRVRLGRPAPRRKSKRKARRFVKGSPEAKRFMAKLRRMQKRKRR